MKVDNILSDRSIGSSSVKALSSVLAIGVWKNKKHTANCSVLSEKSGEISGYQIYITALKDEDTELTRERILQDVPDMTIDNLTNVTVG